MIKWYRACVNYIHSVPEYNCAPEQERFTEKAAIAAIHKLKRYYDEKHFVKDPDYMVRMKSSDGPGMMRQEKHLIKWHAQSGWDIREDQKLKKFPMKEIRRQFPFRGQRLQMGYMISVSVD